MNIRYCGGGKVNTTKIFLVKIGKYIPGRFLCVPQVLFAMVPRNNTKYKHPYIPGTYVNSSKKKH